MFLGRFTGLAAEGNETVPDADNAGYHSRRGMPRDSVPVTVNLEGAVETRAKGASRRTGCCAHARYHRAQLKGQSQCGEHPEMGPDGHEVMAVDTHLFHSEYVSVGQLASAWD